MVLNYILVEGSITEEECVKALQSFPGNNPGNDGLQSNFTVNYGKLLANLSST